MPVSYAWDPFALNGPRIPAPPVHHAYGLNLCDSPVQFPGRRAHLGKYHCGRIAGHTGRHAAYGSALVHAVWTDRPPTATIPILGNVSACEKYDRGFVTATIRVGQSDLKVRISTDLVQVTP